MNELFLAPAVIIDRVRPHIESINPDIFQEVKEACEQSRAFLFVCDLGFVVLKPCGTEDYPGILVWLACSFKHIDRGYFQEQIDRLANSVEARYLEVWSTRKGWKRILPGMGYTPQEPNGKYSVWRKPL